MRVKTVLAMRRSVTWSPDLWSDSRPEHSAVAANRLRRQPSRPRVSDDVFFHIHHPPMTDDAATVAPLVGSRSLGALAMRLSRSRLDDGGAVLPLRASRSLMFDATATHWNEVSANSSGPDEPAEQPAPRWMQVLSPELVPLRPRERSFVLKQRAVVILGQWAGGISSVSSTTLLLSLCDGQFEEMATHSATVGSVNSFLATFMSPVVCALSDQFGRIQFMAAGQLGILLFSLAQTRISSLRQRAIAVVLFHGVMRAGVGVVSQSAFGDLFAAQPEISAVLQASEGIWANLGSFTGLTIGAVVRSFGGDNLCFLCSAVLAALQAAILVSTAETLDARDRKAVGSVWNLLVQANPISSVMLLLRNGPGLCALALARVFWLSSIHCGSLLGSLQLGVLGWNPQDQANFGQAMNLPRIVLQRCFTLPFLARYGTNDVWRISTIGAALGYALVGQSFRRWVPMTGGFSLKSVTMLQYGVIQLLLIDAFVGCTGISLQAMFLKHSMSCVLKDDGKAAGKGEINSAFAALGTLSGMVMPLMWARIYRIFMWRAAHARSSNLVGLPPLSAGGPFIIAGLLMLAARTCLSLVDQRQLYVQEYQFPVEILRPENQKRIRDTLRLHSVELTRFRRGSPGWVFRKNCADLSILRDAWYRWSTLRRQSRPPLIGTFEFFDRSGSGFIEADDLQRVMGKDGMGSGCNSEAFEEMVRLSDADNDGLIGIHDFCRMMCPS